MPGASDPERTVDPRFAAHLPELRTVASGFCRGSSELDDLVQDTLERALRHAATGKPPPRNTRAWLVSIMRNVFIDRVRGAKPTFEPIDDNIAHDAVPELAWSRYTMEDIERALLELDPEQRAVFELHYVRGLRYADVASTLGIPPNTVASRLYRARRAVRDVLLGRAGDSEAP